MKTLLTIVLILATAGSCFAGKGGHKSSSGSKKTKSTAPKTVHVKGHTTKNGTYVAPYDRAAPGSATHSTSVPSTHVSVPYRKNYVAEGYALHSSVQRDKHGKIKRSAAAKSAFEHQQPCPSTGKTGGRCPGYTVDHVNPLECGGADAPYNMQWQTKEAAKQKDKTEKACRI